MGDKSAIEWTDSTWNPTIGCTKVSAGCAHCYFMAEHTRRHLAWKGGTWPDAPRQYHQPATVMQLMADRLGQPLRWRRPRRVFVNSLSDLFHEEVPDAFIDRVFAVMALARRHTFQVLTKRPERMREYSLTADRHNRIELAAEMIREGRKDFGGKHLLPAWPLKNVWLGTSAEDQRAANERIPLLVTTLAAVRFLSCEPLLGPVSIRETGLSFFDTRGVLDWVICGGESGKGARPMHPDWARDLRDECQAAGVPFFFKQWGEFAPIHAPEKPGIFICSVTGETTQDLAKWNHRDCTANHFCLTKTGKKRAGRALDGREWKELPSL